MVAQHKLRAEEIERIALEMPARYDALVQAIAHLDTAASVDEMLGLTLTPPPRG